MKSRNILFITLFLSALILAAFHNAALAFNWYYFFPWIDIPIHIVGGFVIGLLAYVVLVSEMVTGADYTQSSRRDLFVIMFGTFLVSIVWEVLELALFLTRDAGLSIETLSDIIFGLVGSVLAWGVVRLLSRKKSPTI